MMTLRGRWWKTRFLTKGLTLSCALEYKTMRKHLMSLPFVQRLGLYTAKIQKPKYAVKEIESLQCPFVFASLFCSPISSGKIFHDNCEALEIDLRRKAIMRADFRKPGVGVKRIINHSNIHSTPLVASAYL